MEGIKFVEDNSKLFLKYNLSQDETCKTRNTDNMFSLTIFKKPQTTIGYTTMCEDGSHILTIDYDNICKYIVEDELKRLLLEFNLPEFYLFASSRKDIDTEEYGNYHAVCLTKFKPREIIDILSKTHCDSAYRSMPLRTKYRSWVLRTGTKKGKESPSYLNTIRRDCVISNVFEIYNISSAHKNLLLELYPKIDIDKNLIDDDSEKVNINIYETRL